MEDNSERDYQKDGCKTCGGRTVLCPDHNEYMCVDNKCDGSCYHIEGDD